MHFGSPELGTRTFEGGHDSPGVSIPTTQWSTATTPWIEAHNVFGDNEPGLRWGLAEGRSGFDRGFQTYILIGNTTAAASTVRVTFLRTNGTAPIEKNYVVAANSRFNVDVAPAMVAFGRPCLFPDISV